MDPQLSPVAGGGQGLHAHLPGPVHLQRAGQSELGDPARSPAPLGKQQGELQLVQTDP